MHTHGGDGGAAATAILLIPFALALVLYGIGVVTVRRRGGGWPWHRVIAFIAATSAAASAIVLPLIGPPAGFTAHTVVHVMAGMLAPLLLVLSAPVTLALRSLHVSRARRLARLLGSRPARVVSHPVTAGLLSVGGMWVLYATPLYALSQQSLVVHLLVMTHMLVAGYLFAAALVSLDPSPHRAGFGLRMGVLVLALAAHGVLAKTLYANGLPGADITDVRSAALLMYYAGDLVDASLAVLLCAQWYRAAGRRRLRSLARA